MRINSLSNIYFFIFLLCTFVVDGNINIFREEDVHSFKLIGETSDSHLIPVEYVSFGSWESNLVKFYFNCSFSFPLPDAVSSLFPSKDIRNRCKYADALENEYKNFFKISEINGTRPEGYIVNFPFYIQASRDAHVLFTRGPRADPDDYEYEIGT